MHRSFTIPIPRRRVLLAAAAAAGALAALPAASQAATVSLQADGLHYTAAAGEVNAPRLEIVNGFFTYTDRVPLFAGTGCQAISGVSVRCTASNGRHIISLGDQNDSLDLIPDNGSVISEPASVFGGTGDDNLIGGNGFDRIAGDAGDDTLMGFVGGDVLSGLDGNDTLLGGANTDVLAGGAGRDTASYLDHAAAVTVTLDGTANDGQSGEQDNVIPDVENLVGGASADFLVGNDAVNRFEASGGNDQYIGQGGNDVYDASNDAGQDSFFGGAGLDTASYRESTTAVRVSLDGVRNDGRTNELDAISTDVENLVGSAFSDVLTGSSLANNIVGLAGNDSITGRTGADRLDGREGSDSIAARDGIEDTVLCSTGTDNVSADQIDRVSTECETVSRS